MAIPLKLFSSRDRHFLHRSNFPAKWFMFVWLMIWSSCCTPVTQGRYRCMLKDFIRLGNSCYFLSAEIASWQEAHFRCRDRGSQLAVLASHYEDSTLRSYLERPEFAQLGRWIGGMWASGKWIWAAQGSEIDNEKSFVNDGAYNLGETDQWMCLYMDPSNRYHWNNENCMRQYHYICEAPLAKDTSSSADDASPANNGREPAILVTTLTFNSISQQNNITTVPPQVYNSTLTVEITHDIQHANTDAVADSINSDSESSEATGGSSSASGSETSEDQSY